MSIELILADHPIRAVEALARDLQTHRPSDPFEPQVVWLTDPSLEGWVKTWIAHHAGIAANLRFVPLREGLLGAWAVDGKPMTEPSVAELAGDVLGVWRSSPEHAPPELNAGPKHTESDRAAREAGLANQVGQWLQDRYWDGSTALEPPWLQHIATTVTDLRPDPSTTPPTAVTGARTRVLASRSLTEREWALLEALHGATAGATRVYESVSSLKRSATPDQGSVAGRLLTAESRAPKRPASVVQSHYSPADGTGWRWSMSPSAELACFQAALRGECHTPTHGTDATEVFMPAWSPRREVEALRDRLLRRLHYSATDRIEPRDVLVLTPDLGTYGPLIASVFAAQGKPERMLQSKNKDGATSTPDDSTKTRRSPIIPTRLLGLGLSQTNPAAAALLDMLSLCADRFTAPDLYALATNPLVQSRFGIPAGSTELLEDILRDSGACWGLDGTDKEAVYGIDNHAHMNTLGFGLERLALSAFLHDEGTDRPVARLPKGPLAPLAAASRDHIHLSGALTSLTGVLRSIRTQLRALSPGSSRAWRQALLDALQHLTKTGATTAWLTRTVQEVIEDTLVDRDDILLELEGVRRILRGRFEQPVSVKGDYGSTVLVQPLRPGAIPARSVVVFLGMGSGAYPRRPRRPEWWPKAPGASPLELQRKAFADAILAAGREVWVTYSARELKKGQEQPPSSLVQELEDLLCPAEGKDPRDQWRTPQGRHAWSLSAVPSFSAVERSARQVKPTGNKGNPKEVLDAPKDADDGRTREVSFRDFVGALLNPSKVFLKDRMKIYIDEAPSPLPEREPMGPSGWDQRELPDVALQWMQENRGAELRAYGNDVNAHKDAVGRIGPSRTAAQKAKTKMDDQLGKREKEASLTGTDQKSLIATRERLERYEAAGKKESMLEKERKKIQKFLEKEASRAASWAANLARLTEAYEEAKAKMEQLQQQLETARDRIPGLRTLLLNATGESLTTEGLGRGTSGPPSLAHHAASAAGERALTLAAALVDIRGQSAMSVSYGAEVVHNNTPVKLSVVIPEVRTLANGDSTRKIHQWWSAAYGEERLYLQAWLGIWIARAEGHNVEAARIIRKGDENAASVTWLVPAAAEGVIPSLDPERVLQDLLKLVDAAQVRPLPLFKKSSMALAQQLRGIKSDAAEETLKAVVAKASGAVANKWYRTNFNPFADEVDRWIAALHFDTEPHRIVQEHPDLLKPVTDLYKTDLISAGFVELSRLLWDGPAAAHLSETEMKKSDFSELYADWSRK